MALLTYFLRVGTEVVSSSLTLQFITVLFTLLVLGLSAFVLYFGYRVVSNKSYIFPFFSLLHGKISYFLII